MITDKGAIPTDSGIFFRVWAPDVDAVSVAGSFNTWSEDANFLSQDGGGMWSTLVPDATIGDEYKFVIHEGAFPPIMKNDPYARDVKTSAGNSVIVDSAFSWSGDDFQIANWNELVIYELHVGTFNDDIDPGLGTFRSVVARLPDLRNLGINALLIMPAAEFPGDLSWGYNPAHPFAIEGAFGTPQDFQAFVLTAHQHGIAVLMDVVYNHFGPNDLDLWRFTRWNQNDKGGIYFYNDRRCATPFGDTRPDYGRQDVRDYIRDNVRMWLNEYHCDGLRFDATAFIRNIFGNNDDPFNDIPDGWGLMQSINDEVKATQPWKLMIAEDIRGNSFITRDTSIGGAGFDSQWTLQFLNPVRQALVVSEDSQRSMGDIRNALLQRYNTDAFERIIYLESHDEVAASLNTAERADHYRLPELIWRGNADSWFSRKRSTLGAALLLTSPGIPMLFQGQELLEWGSWSDTTPLQWSRLGSATFAGIWALYQALIQLRRNFFGNTRGLLGQHVNVYHLNENDKVMAYHRWQDGGSGDDVIIVLNFSTNTFPSYTIGFPRPGTWYVRFNSDWNGFGPDFGNTPGYDTTSGRAVWGDTDGLFAAGNIGIGPYSALILSQ